jgi:L-lactate dehydrogenase complex protein LldG
LGSTEAKSAIFASIRQNLAASVPFDRIHDEHAAHLEIPPDPAIKTPGESFREISLTEKFRENLIAIGGNCEVVRNKLAAAALIQTIIGQRKPERIAISDAELVGELSEGLKTGAQILANASKAELFECDLGITGAQLGIAETGTLVLESEKEFHRLTSLIPPVHVCLLETRNLRGSLGEALEILETDLSRTITFITGPSRTSDIELTLAIGVHGPAELFVILIEDL